MSKYLFWYFIRFRPFVGYLPRFQEIQFTLNLFWIFKILPLLGFCVGSLFCNAVHNVLSSFAIILLRKRSSWFFYLNCFLGFLCSVSLPCGTVDWSVIMAFPARTHLDLFSIMWARTWDFQQCGISTCVDSDKPLYAHFKLRHSKWCSVSSLTIIKYSSD